MGKRDKVPGLRIVGRILQGRGLERDGGVLCLQVFSAGSIVSDHTEILGEAEQIGRASCRERVYVLV